MRITIEQLHQRVLDLRGRDDGIEWNTLGLDGQADPQNGTIRILPIRSEAAYAVALHEIGHIRCRHLDNLDDLSLGAEDAAGEVLACERRAWEQARDNALIWTPTMECEADAGIAHYEAHFGGTTSPRE